MGSWTSCNLLEGFVFSRSTMIQFRLHVSRAFQNDNIVSPRIMHFIQFFNLSFWILKFHMDHWLTGWLAVRLAGRLLKTAHRKMIDRLIDWLINWFIHSFIHRSIERNNFPLCFYNWDWSLSTSSSGDRPGESSLENYCCWWLTFRQPERKSSSESSGSAGTILLIFCNFLSEIPSPYNPGKQDNSKLILYIAIPVGLVILIALIGVIIFYVWKHRV